MKRIKVLILVLVLFLSVKTGVFAEDVILNEFLVDPDSNQWVELYNKGTSSVDISGWFIDDNGGTQKFTIPENTIIGSSEFKVFESSFFNLNRATSDVASLLNGSILIDSYSYDTGPGVNRSFGRQIDGTGDWVIFDNPTKGVSNNLSTPIPIPSPSPISTPTSTSTPSPTHSPSPTKSPTPKSPTPTKSPTPAKSTPTPSKSSSQTSDSKILAIATVAISEIPSSKPLSSQSPSPATTAVLGSSSANNLPKILMGIGSVFLLACGILTFRKLKTKNEE